MHEPSACLGWTLSASQKIQHWININAFLAMILARPSFTSGVQLRAFGLNLLSRPSEMGIYGYEVCSKGKSERQIKLLPWYRMSAQDFLTADVCATRSG